MKEYTKIYLNGEIPFENMYKYFKQTIVTEEWMMNLEKEDLFDLSFIIWYLLDDAPKYAENDKEKFYVNLYRKLALSYEVSKIRFSDDSDFMCIYGYLMNVMPYNFLCIDGWTYEVCLEESNELLKKSNDINNPLGQLFYFTNIHEPYSNGLCDRAIMYLKNNYSNTAIGFNFVYVVENYKKVE